MGAATDNDAGKCQEEPELPENCFFFRKCALKFRFYGLEACPLTKSDLSAIDFVVNRFFMKLLRTDNIETVKSCQYCFNF